MSCDDSSLFRWATRRQTTISFANLSIIYLSRPFEDDFSVRYMLYYLAAYPGYVRGVRWQRLCILQLYLIISCTFVLIDETHESHTCLTLAKNPSIMEKLYLMVALRSNNCHCICSLQPRGQNNLMVTLKSLLFLPLLFVTSWVEHTRWLH